jgi:hypothetical protein
MNDFNDGMGHKIHINLTASFWVICYFVNLVH